MSSSFFPVSMFPDSTFPVSTFGKLLLLTIDRLDAFDIRRSLRPLSVGKTAWK
jgi:hypothetical protein